MGKRGVFKTLLKETAQQMNDGYFKIIESSHIKVHQDVCYQCKSTDGQKFGKTKSGRNGKLHAMTHSKGKLLDSILLADNEAEIKSAKDLLADVTDYVILTDRGYDSDELREYIEKH